MKKAMLLIVLAAVVFSVGFSSAFAADIERQGNDLVIYKEPVAIRPMDKILKNVFDPSILTDELDPAIAARLISGEIPEAYKTIRLQFEGYDLRKFPLEKKYTGERNVYFFNGEKIVPQRNMPISFTSPDMAIEKVLLLIAICLLGVSLTINYHIIMLLVFYASLFIISLISIKIGAQAFAHYQITIVFSLMALTGAYGAWFGYIFNGNIDRESCPSVVCASFAALTAASLTAFCLSFGKATSTSDYFMGLGATMAVGLFLRLVVHMIKKLRIKKESKKMKLA